MMKSTAWLADPLTSKKKAHAAEMASKEFAWSFVCAPGVFFSCS
jgi:hypothetical protein